MLIAALAKASVVFDQPAWLEAAQTVFSFVIKEMDQDGRLRHVWCAGDARHPAVIDDYANMARAALTPVRSDGRTGVSGQGGIMDRRRQSTFLG